MSTSGDKSVGQRVDKSFLSCKVSVAYFCFPRCDLHLQGNNDHRYMQPHNAQEQQQTDTHRVAVTSIVTLIALQVDRQIDRQLHLDRD